MRDERQKRSDWSYCPACGGGIDTGYECNKCGRDWLEFHETRQALLDKCAARERAVWLEAARLIEDSMKWTSEKPSVPGWYWLRAPKRGWRDCVMWVEDHGDGFCIDVSDGETETVDEIDGQWAGPIPAPEEAI